MTPAEVGQWLREQRDYFSSGNRWSMHTLVARFAVDELRHLFAKQLATAADLIESLQTEADTYLTWANTAKEQIESLTAERDALAAMVLAKDEALKAMLKANENPPRCSLDIMKRWEAYMAALHASRIELPAAVAQVAEWKEAHAIIKHLPKLEYWVRKDIWTCDKGGTTFDTAEEALRAAKEAENAK